MKTYLKEFVEQFDSVGNYVTDKMERGIEENRKGQFVLNFIDASGEPLENVQVKVRQISHEFHFGCTAFSLGMYEEPEYNRLYEEKFAKIFNFAVLPLYWAGLEPEQGNPRFGKDSSFVYRRPPLDTAVEFCRKHGIHMKGHCLVYNSFQPDWISNDNRELKIQIDNRLKALAERYGNTFHDLDVINEMISIYKNCYPGNGCRNMQVADEVDHEEWAFRLCKKYFPYADLYWNEGGYETFSDTNYHGHRSFYYQTLKDHLMRGTPIEGIGMQYHLYYDIPGRDPIVNIDFDGIKHMCHPLRMFDVFERYSDFGLPISISEISIPSHSNDPEEEYYQGELIRRLYTLWFSQKNIQSIVYWTMADHSAFGIENQFHQGLVRKDFTEKPAYRVLDELINKTWHTEFAATANGRLDFSGFYGNYQIEATHNGKTVTKTVRLCKDTTGYDNRLVDFRAVNISLEDTQDSPKEFTGYINQI